MELGMTQEALARRADTSLNLVNRVERGETRDPHITTLAALANALEVSVSALVEEPELVGKAEASEGEEAPKALPNTIEELLESRAVESRWFTLPDEEFERWWLDVSREEAIDRYWQIKREFDVLTETARAARSGERVVGDELAEWLQENWSRRLFRRKWGTTWMAPGKEELEEEFYERQARAEGRRPRQVDLHLDEDEASEKLVATR